MQEIRVNFQQDIYSVTLVWRNSDADDDAIVVVLMRGWRHFEMSESLATISSISWRFTFFSDSMMGSQADGSEHEEFPPEESSYKSKSLLTNTKYF